MNKIIEWFTTNGENIKTVAAGSSAVISFFMWNLNRKNSIFSSYTQKAKPQILIKNIYLFEKYQYILFHMETTLINLYTFSF